MRFRRTTSLGLASALLVAAFIGTVSGPTAAAFPLGGVTKNVPETCPGQIHDNDTGVERIAGADRYAVSAAISARTFAPGVRVAYIVSGATFPDALSASAAAGVVGSPVLLVAPDSIPKEVADELKRLKPSDIIIVGGPASVSPAVESSLKGFASAVQRFGGADRYEVSANVLKGIFNIGSDKLYVASGAGFADALAGAAAAGAVGGPVALVTKDDVPAGVDYFFLLRTPRRIALLGGTDSVSNSVALELGETARTNRLAGADRFEVAAKVSSDLFCAETHTVYIASGTTFPDALSGSAAAIKNGGPMLLVTRDGIPAPIAAELRRIGPAHIVVLGGTATISEAVVTELEGYLAH
ncbi:Putative cell wall binding repeat 2 [Herbiconiux ginsengi]|uniref:Putative cell wall binding repeat 2 n=1 Tax=Herbiconiux ginsengi TaxID=381665 RepID=A0A1H3N3Q8_9MICO|nr:Putative cell wall binding repeat 2 [Herbiconiux ginsengi]